MQKKLRSSLILGVVAASVAIVGIPVSAAGEQMKSRFGFNNIAEEAEGFFEKEFNPKENEERPIGFRFNAIMNDFSWAVDEGIISQDKADKIAAYMQEASEAMKDAMEKAKGMSPEERKELAGNKRSERRDIFNELVDAGIITDAEAEALKEAMPMPELPETGSEGKNFHIASPFGLRSFDTLVESGIIDQETAEKMEEYISKKADEIKSEMEIKKEEMQTDMKERRKEMKTQMDGMKGMTAEERKALFESGNALPGLREPSGVIGIKEPFDIIGQMVSEGIITQSQADAIKEAMPAKRANVRISSSSDL